MLKYSVFFLLVAIIAAIFGFGGLVTSAAGIAQILFWVFIAFALVTFIISVAQATTSTT
jgi:uncharacterized membrane protein YtjA (UPF0391 family)